MLERGTLEEGHFFGQGWMDKDSRMRDAPAVPKLRKHEPMLCMNSISYCLPARHLRFRVYSRCARIAAYVDSRVSATMAGVAVWKSQRTDDSKRTPLRERSSNSPSALLRDLCCLADDQTTRTSALLVVKHVQWLGSQFGWGRGSHTGQRRHNDRVPQRHVAELYAPSEHTRRHHAQTCNATRRAMRAGSENSAT